MGAQALLLTYDIVVASGGYIPPIAGYLAYYDATVPSSITIATGVSQWNDRSGNGHNLVQSILVKQPVYSGSGLSSIVTFNGSNNTLQTLFSSLSQPFTVYLVINPITWGNNHYFVDGGAMDQLDIFQGNTTPDIALYAGTTMGYNTGLVLGTTKVVCAVFNGSSSSLSVNDGTKTTGNAGSSAITGFTLGSNGAGSTGFSNCAISYALIYNTAQSSANQTTVVSGLRTYFGI